MLFIFGNAEARRPGHFPWTDAIQTALALMLVAGVISAGIALGTDLFSGKNAPVAQPGQEVQKQAPAAEDNPLAESNSAPGQTESGVEAVAWPLVRVEWTLVSDLSILPPAEQGFYNGTMQNTPYGSSSTVEGAEYARTIVPTYNNTTAVVAATRDPANKQVALVGLDLMYPARIENHQILEDARPAVHLFLSTDGEKSWREIPLPPGRFEEAIVLPWEVRVVSRDNSIVLFVLAGGGGDSRWHQATLPQ